MKEKKWTVMYKDHNKGTYGHINVIATTIEKALTEAQKILIKGIVNIEIMCIRAEYERANQ